jgi:hypothetical protein
VAFSGLPKNVVWTTSSSVQRVRGRVYLFDRVARRVLVVGEDGKYVALRDLAPLIGPTQQSDEQEIRGFSVDEEGNFLFTIPTNFKAYIVSPRNEIKSFGTAGSRPGRFNVVGPIVRDEHGIVYVGDLLRSVVMLFDKDLNFLVEVGGRGSGPGRLVAPSFLAAGNGKLFVAQGASRGVSVFRVERT